MPRHPEVEKEEVKPSNIGSRLSSTEDVIKEESQVYIPRQKLNGGVIKAALLKCDSDDYDFYSNGKSRKLFNWGIVFYGKKPRYSENETVHMDYDSFSASGNPIVNNIFRMLHHKISFKINTVPKRETFFLSNNS